MDVVLQIALIVFPAGGVLLTAIYFLRRETSKEVIQMQVELRRQRQAKGHSRRIRSQRSPTIICISSRLANGKRFQGRNY